MKCSLLISLCIVLCACMANAQPNVGSIDVFSDPGYADCNFTDTAGGLITVYILVTRATDGTSGAQWKLDIPSAWTWLGQSSPWLTVIGQVHIGISISYSGCQTGTFLILTTNFIGNGLSPPCSFISIVPDPTSPTGLIEVVDCQVPFLQKWMFPILGQGVVNSDGTCSCAIPVQETTWGRVKSLYQ